MSTMLFHDEIVPASEIHEVPTGRSAPKVAPAEVKMASQIIDSLTRDWDPKRYEDTYRVEVLDFLKKKAAGEEIVVEEEPEEQADVIDLMAALEASLEAAKKSGSRPARRRPPKKAPSRRLRRPVHGQEGVGQKARRRSLRRRPGAPASSSSSAGAPSSGSKRKSA